MNIHVHCTLCSVYMYIQSGSLTGYYNCMTITGTMKGTKVHNPRAILSLLKFVSSA